MPLYDYPEGMMPSGTEPIVRRVKERGWSVETITKCLQQLYNDTDNPVTDPVIVVVGEAVDIDVPEHNKEHMKKNNIEYRVSKWLKPDLVVVL